MTAPASDAGRGMRWIFPVAYLTVTHSTVGLMVLVGLFGDPVLAADIALAHGATFATFHALSANTRALILGQSQVVTIADILRMRLVLAAPLAVAAYALATAGTGVAAWLAAFIVLRRCGEWFNDLQLCKAELEHRTAFAKGFLALQTVLLAAAAFALVTDFHYAPIVIAAWALLPIGFAMALRRDLSGDRSIAFLRVLRRVLPHAGSTAVSGLALYAFRILVVLLIAKELAGDLFTAIAIGSFIGTIFANVLGPSVELHERRTGHGLPLMVSVAVWGTLGAALVITATSILAPALLEALGKPRFFWLACGLSLAGGVVMVQAQRVRLRVLRHDDGRDIFGPEVLIHVALLVSTPLLILAGGPTGVTSLYLVNAVIAYLFYRSADIAQQRLAIGEKRVLDKVRLVIGFLLVFPLFFQLAGGIYDSPTVVMDSGGQLATLPLPVSMLACFGGILVLADYRRATRSVTFIFLFFAAMLLSLVVTKPAGQTFDRANILLLMQFLLPTFGLVLGEFIETDRARAAHVVERAFYWGCAAIIPAQLVATWLQGRVLLTHWLGLFSVYQHQQFVPVVLACAALVSATVLRSERAYRPWALPLLVLSLMYAFAAASLLAIFIAGIGLLVFYALQLRTLGLRRGLAVAVVGVVLTGTIAMLVVRAPGNDLGPKLMSHETLQDNYDDRFGRPCSGDTVDRLSPLVRSDGQAWIIRGIVPSGRRTLIECGAETVQDGDMLVMEGEVRSGGVTIGIIGSDASMLESRRVDRVGPFRYELRPTAGQYRAIVTSAAPREIEVDVSISHLVWRPTMSDSPTLRAGKVPETLARMLPLNLVERIGDWMLFGLPVFSSVETFLFGHPRPLERSVRTSAHNYYIDLAYNFGTVALLPILGLILYTLRLLWLRRREFWRDDRLRWIAAIVLFLVLVDSNFKVTLRQPYPGIFSLFLWGVLLGRLSTASATGHADDKGVRPARHVASGAKS